MRRNQLPLWTRLCTTLSLAGLAGMPAIAQEPAVHTHAVPQGPFARPAPRLATGQPSPLDEDVLREVNALRADPGAWAHRLAVLVPLLEGDLLKRPGRPAVRWPGGAQALTRTIERLQAQAPLPPVQLSPGMAAAARDYVRVRPVGDGGEYTAYGPAAQRYGTGKLWGQAVFLGDGDAFDIVAAWARNEPEAELLRPDVSVVGVACAAQGQGGHLARRFTSGIRRI
jgi:hypothetical protein